MEFIVSGHCRLFPMGLLFGFPKMNAFFSGISSAGAHGFINISSNGWGHYQLGVVLSLK